MHQKLMIAIIFFLTQCLYIAQGNVLKVYNWSDYIDPELITEFTQKTGINVIYDTYDSNDILLSKMLAGKTGYDLILPSEYTVAYLIEANLLAPLDFEKIPNHQHIAPEITQKLNAIPGVNEYSINYMWGTTGIAFNVDKVKERIDNPPLDSFALLFDPLYVSKLADCGVYLLDSPEEVLPVVLHYLGLPADSTSNADLAKAQTLLNAIRPYIKKFHSSEYINAIANGDACLVLGWSGDLLQAKKRSLNSKKPMHIEYVIPKEGSMLWFDQFAIPKDAPNPDAAYQFINFLLEPSHNARAATFIEYATSNHTARQLLPPEIRNHPALYPSPTVLDTLFVKHPYPQAEQRKLTRLWTRFKTQK